VLTRRVLCAGAGALIGLLAIVSGTSAGANTVGRPAESRRVVTTTDASTSATDATTAATTTLPATTTVASTASTTVPPTTTTTSTSTTTVPASTPSTSSSSTPWGWIIAALAVVAVILVVVLAFMRRAAVNAKHSWRHAAASALRDGDLTRDMLEGEARPGEREDPARRNTVRDNVERVAAHFDQLAADAPDDNTRRNAASVAESLRGYFFALEAENLLRDAPIPPTADQLATADATRRQRAGDLDSALGAIRSYVGDAGGENPR